MKVVFAKAFVLLGILVSLSVSVQAQEQKDLWKKTGLSFADLKYFLSQARCYNNENAFLGCINTVNFVLAERKEPLVLSNKSIETLSYMGAPAGTQNGVDMRLLKDQKAEPKLELSEAVKRMQADRAVANAAWKAVFAATAKSQIDFGGLLDFATVSVPTDLTESRVASAINTFYGTAFDPHTYIMSPDGDDDRSQSAQNFVGAGMYVKKVEDKIILQPMEGSPALKAGIHNKDELIAIDGQSVEKLDLVAVTAKIKGVIGTTVNVTVLRGTQNLTIAIIRGNVDILNMESKLLTDSSGEKTGYIRLRSFMVHGTCKAFKDAGLKLRDEGAKNLILDLRDDGGGLVDEALCMASLYAPQGQLLLTFRNPATNKVLQFGSIVNTKPSAEECLMALQFPQLFDFSPLQCRLDDSAYLDDAYKKPLVVMLNANSASASELLTGVLQDYKKAIIVGERSFGKGSMQDADKWQEVPSQQSASGDPIKLYKTEARFHLPSGRSNQLVGLEPDFEVYANPHPTDKDKFEMRERDLYPNAINPSVIPFTPNTAAINQVKSCLAKRNDLEQRYNDEQNDALGADYQKVYAEEVSLCL